MILTFAGVGGAFCTANQWQSNMVLKSKKGKRLLIDCGSDARFSFGELGLTNRNIGQWIDAIYVSHLHGDHVAGLEYVGFCSYFSGHQRPKLFIAEPLVDPIWETFRAAMQYHDRRKLTMDHYFDIRTVKPDKIFEWEGYQFKLVKTIHVQASESEIMPSYGLYFGGWPGKDVFLTTDTKFLPELYEQHYRNARLIFHDCETYSHRSGVHAHYEDLRTLPPEIKRKMWLYHYDPNHSYNYVDDGFAGFVVKHQSFNLE